MNLPDFSNSNVLIVGDVMLDRYWSGSTARISPEAPVPIVNVSDSEDRPGGAANVATNAAALGANVKLVGMVGDDPPATVLKDKLNVHGIHTQLNPVKGFDTITKLRVMSRNQQLIRLDFEKNFSAVDKQSLLAEFSDSLQSADVVVLSDYAKGTLSDPQAFISMAKSSGKTIIVDPKGSDFSKYAGATFITPNMSEFEQVVGQCKSEKDVSDKAEALIKQFDIESILLTRSEQGMSFFYHDSEAKHINRLDLPAQAKEVYDVTGAGDTVVSTLAACLAVKISPPTACQLANHAASIVVGKVGTSSVTNTELALSINAKSHIDTGIMNQEQLKLAVEHAQSDGQKVVMTNGCFDILHSGHVSYLNAAAKMGDRLIVAVNTDESVRKLKGTGRPINNVDRRMAVLAGLSAVDWVIPFSDDTPQALIADILPDILVKGGDYVVSDIAGGKEVLANGGKVEVLHFEEGVSTTAIIEQIVDEKGSV